MPVVGGGSEKSLFGDFMFCVSLDVEVGVFQIDDSDGLFIILIITDDSAELGAVAPVKFALQIPPASTFPPLKEPKTPVR